MQLDPEERAEFIEDVRQAIEPGEFTDEQIAEFERRSAETDAGGPTIPGELVMERLRQKLAKK